MNRKNKKLAIKTVEGILEFLYDTARLLPLPLETPHMWARRLRKYESGRVTYALNRLRDQGKVRITRVGNQKFIRLTELGQLQVLLLKSVQNLPKVWDKKWRVIIFDIPEQARSQRNQFRILLKRIGFVKLQASVFISPFPISKEVVEYLQIGGLINHIRILRVDQLDNETELLKKYCLKK